MELRKKDKDKLQQAMETAIESWKPFLGVPDPNAREDRDSMRWAWVVLIVAALYFAAHMAVGFYLWNWPNG